MVSGKNRGLTMIELLVVLAILSIFILAALFAYKTQLAKGRDARRKADLNKLQKILEDYLNDENCYPDNLTCGVSFTPYLSQVPCDPVNNIYYNYFYSYDDGLTCRKWYKIYSKLENTKDPIIERMGCASGCGPSGNYNYWISSPNMNEVAQILPGEAWWPPIAGVTPPEGAPTLPAGATPTPTPTVIVGPTSTPTLTPTPPAGPTSTPTPTIFPTPTSSPVGNYYGCFSGVCAPLSGPDCEPNYLDSDCFGQCVFPQNECK